MARGLQIITPYSTYDDRTAANDIIIVQPADYQPPDSPSYSRSENTFSRSHETDTTVTAVPEEPLNIPRNESSSSSRNQSHSNHLENDLNHPISQNEVNSSSTSRSRDFLSSLTHHVPILDGISQPSLEETRAAGQVLFQQFVQQYISREVDSSLNLEIMEDAIPAEVPEDINRAMHNTATVNGYPHPKLSAFGRDLRKIAEKFEQSQERIAIRRKADQVDLNGIQYDDFKSLLCNFFEDGSISRSRIIVLFFFCSDLARRAVLNGTLNLCRQLFTWSVAFILGSVCSWVQKQGGWGVVLGDYIPKLAVTLCALAGCVAFAVYIKKNL